ncbi:MAG: hypothetical protein EOM25_10845 [Deltaproteobacteria bacterium]|nr:hypothetical protein [Deltaproteobacteria bacterium]
MNILKTSALCLIALILAVGCTALKRQKQDVTGPPPVDLIAEARNASADLTAGLLANMQPDVPIIVTSLVNVDNVQESSRFGRIFSELLASGLSRQGFLVKELKMSQKDIFVRKQSGEFALSRDLRDIATNQNVQAVAVGTYAVASSTVYVSVRMIGSADDLLISSWDQAIPLDSNIRAMLRKPEAPETSVGSLSQTN